MTNQLFRDYLDTPTTPKPKPKPKTLGEELASIGEAFQTVGKAIYDAYAELFSGLNPLIQTLQDAGVIPTPPPSDPRERALWMRDHQNHGPKPEPLHKRGRITKYQTKG